MSPEELEAALAEDLEQKLIESNHRNLSLQYTVDSDAQIKEKQRSALKRMGAKLRARGKALVEVQARYEFVIFECSQKAQDTYCNLFDGYCAFDNCPIREKLYEIAHERLRREGKL